MYVFVLSVFTSLLFGISCFYCSHWNHCRSVCSECLTLFFFDTTGKKAQLMRSSAGPPAAVPFTSRNSPKDCSVFNLVHIFSVMHSIVSCTYEMWDYSKAEEHFKQMHTHMHCCCPLIKALCVWMTGGALFWLPWHCTECHGIIVTGMQWFGLACLSSISWTMRPLSLARGQLTPHYRQACASRCPPLAHQWDLLTLSHESFIMSVSHALFCSSVF